jgi:hypothetical protein
VAVADVQHEGVERARRFTCRWLCRHCKTVLSERTVGNDRTPTFEVQADEAGVENAPAAA